MLVPVPCGMDSLDKRVSRILGQMKGIQKMIKDDRDCVEILQQVSSVKKAIDGFTKEVLIDYFIRQNKTNNISEIEKIISQVIDL